jgi:hypothetical protein
MLKYGSNISDEEESVHFGQPNWIPGQGEAMPEMQ